jgi:mono/diheme cytochrome c family protein
LEIGSGNASAAITSPVTKPIALNKGPNPLRATYTAPAAGDAIVRLGWTEKGTNVIPVAQTALTHPSAASLVAAEQLRSGRELFLESRCFQCHTDPTVASNGVPELAMDAPALAGIGGRRHYEWLTRWIFEPKSVRPAARMPKVLHGPTARTDAEAIAAYLASLQDEALPPPSPMAYQSRQAPPEGEAGAAPTAPAAEPRPIYERLHCGACHNPPDAKEIDPKKLSQKGVGTKFPKGRLAEYLLGPEAGYRWTRMPNFHLSAAEAGELEKYLLDTADPPKDLRAPTDAALLAKGRQLLQTSGCLNCHVLASPVLTNMARAPSLSALHSRHLKERSALPPGDCLGATPLADYGFKPEEKAALTKFTEAGFVSLTRHAPWEFAARQTRQLSCTACHGQIELVPPLEILGGKLNPEWSARFMAGDIPHKIRYDNHPKGEVWLEARMPAFRSRASDLARGLAALHGFPPQTPTEGPIDTAAADAGRKLVGKDGGLSCVSCHGVGPQAALEVFESEGINLAYTADRLLPGYYRRWFANPLSVDPQTKMPMYFDDDGNSPLTDVLGGNGDAQIAAVWHYLRLRDKMPPPKSGLE